MHGRTAVHTTLTKACRGPWPRLEWITTGSGQGMISWTFLDFAKRGVTRSEVRCHFSMRINNFLMGSDEV
jgi:hypothetical protein